MTRTLVDPEVIDVLDGDTFEVIAAGVALAESLDPDDHPEEYAAARAELLAAGRFWIGGGAAPLFYLRVSGARVA